MGIVRSWLRGLLGVSGVTLLVPVGLVAALAVAATIGGSGLGSVGQLVGGPEVPGAPQAAFTRPERTLPTVPARRERRERRARRAAAPPAPARTPVRTTTTTSTTAPQRTTTTRPTGGRVPAPPPSTSTSPPPPPPTTTTERNPVRRIGAAVQGVVKPLPIVGGVASDAVGTVIGLIAPPGS